MKRFWVFIYFDYYPRGGMEDFKKSFDSIEEASFFCEEYKSEMCSKGHILDYKEFTIIKTFSIEMDSRPEWNEDIFFI